MPTESQQLAIIDAIGPFFQGYTDTPINWSKVPFHYLECDGHVDGEKFQQIRHDLTIFLERVVKMGYNAISLDDVAHLVNFDWYPSELQQKIREYQKEYGTLIALARDLGLKVFVTTDLMFFNSWIDEQTGDQDDAILEVLREAFTQLFTNFPVDGIITRIGETDGVDVQGDFHSRLTLKTPQQANRYICDLLPIFEQYDTLLIFRTWTVGAYAIGDLIWNEQTYDQVFAGLNSSHLIVSMKYGDTDFFDHLPLNPLFFRGPCRKMLELQTRREREGFGVLPYYVGWQYEAYYKQVKDLSSMAGISVWCQTGGWAQWHNLTFITNSSIWNELNTTATIAIFQGKGSADMALERFFERKKMVKFVKRYHRFLERVLYVEGFADTPLYFMRVRIPPLLWVCWDQVTLNPLMAALHSYGGEQPFRRHKKRLKKLRKLGRKLEIPDIEFLYDTLDVLAACRKAMWKKRAGGKLPQKLTTYREKYPDSFDFSSHLPMHSSRIVPIAFKFLLRTQPEYRWIDKFLMRPFMLRLIYRAFRFFSSRSNNLPKFVDKQAMPLEVLFKS